MKNVTRAILEKKRRNHKNDKFISEKQISLTKANIFIDGHIIAKILANSNLNNASELRVNFLKKEV